MCRFFLRPIPPSSPHTTIRPPHRAQAHQGIRPSLNHFPWPHSDVGRHNERPTHAPNSTWDTFNPAIWAEPYHPATVAIHSPCWRPYGDREAFIPIAADRGNGLCGYVLPSLVAIPIFMDHPASLCDQLPISPLDTAVRTWIGRHLTRVGDICTNTAMHDFSLSYIGQQRLPIWQNGDKNTGALRPYFPEFVPDLPAKNIPISGAASGPKSPMRPDRWPKGPGSRARECWPCRRRGKSPQ